VPVPNSPADPGSAQPDERLSAVAVADFAAGTRAADQVGGPTLRRLLRQPADGVAIDADHPDLAAVRRAHGELAAARAGGSVYGLTTGVGALRHVTVGQTESDQVTSDDDPHALQLLLSHAGGLGPELDDGLARATMLVRLNQLLQGGAGLSAGLAAALANAVRDGAVPRLHTYGSIGTGDLSVLAELGLTLCGQLPWRSGSAPRAVLGAGDGLPMISSNAMTAALGARVTTDLIRLAAVSERVAALSHLALRGSREAYDVRVIGGRDHPHATAVAGRLTALLGSAAGPAARVQDPFGLRAIPQVHGVWLEQLDLAERAVTAELNTASENPQPLDGGAFHHGQFLTQRIAATLDAARQAAVPALGLSVARLAALCNPELTGLAPFLAAGPPGSSGVMITEYVAGDLLARARATVGPVTAHRTTVSLGLEEHASHSTQAAWLGRDLCDLVAPLLACELVAAVRALRLAEDRLTDAPATGLFELAAARWPHVPGDHVLGPELQAATELIRSLAGPV
jgi:histidine ammonia-lyase